MVSLWRTKAGLASGNRTCRNAYSNRAERRMPLCGGSGVAARANEAGARELAGAAARFGYRAFLCPVDDRLHLASAITPLGARRLIGTRSGFASLDAAEREVAPDDVERLVIPDAAVGGANVLAAGGRCFVARGFPAAVRALASAGESVVEVELDEFLFADGGPTCLVAPI